MSFLKSLKAMFGGKAAAKKGECCDHDHGHQDMQVADKCCDDENCACERKS